MLCTIIYSLIIAYESFSRCFFSWLAQYSYILYFYLVVHMTLFFFSAEKMSVKYSFIMATLQIGDSIYTKYYGLIGVDSFWFIYHAYSAHWWQYIHKILWFDWSGFLLILNSRDVRFPPLLWRFPEFFFDADFGFSLANTCCLSEDRTTAV